MRTPLLSILPLLLPALAAQRPTAALQELPGAAATAADRAGIGASGAPAAVVFDRPREGGPLWALGRAWKASFDGRGMTVVPFFGSSAPQNFPLAFELVRATVAGSELELADGEPVVTGAAVHTPRGALTEVVETALDRLEQSFVFASLPQRGAVAVELRVDTALAASPVAGGVRFANEHGYVDYTTAIAVDAAGRKAPLAIEWTGTGVRMVIPEEFVAEAALPLVLDPVLNFWYLLGSNPGQLQHDSDVASIQAPNLGGRTLMIYQRQWSASDQDCWGIMFDGNLGLVATDFSIDFTTDDWLKVAVAGHNYAQNFLVVAEVRVPVFLGSLFYIGGRGVAANATPGSVFDIERDGVVGSGGNNFHPDVGGDPYYGVGRFTVVFEKQNGAASGIYMKQVTTAYGAVTANPIALDTTPNQQSRPSISKSCGQSNGQPAHWFVTWQRTWQSPPFDQEVWARFVNWNGALPGNAFGIATSASEDTAPSAGSPFDSNGVRYWPMCFETAPAAGQPRDVLCRIYRADLVLQKTFTVSNNVPGADDRDPEIDSDGARFVTIFTTGTSGYPQSIEAVTAALLPATNTIRIDERTGLQTSSAVDYGEGNVCADYSGGSALSPRYFLSFTDLSTNTFDLKNFGGWTTGQFFVPRPTQCGSLSIQVTGSPVIGQTVTATVGLAPLSGTILGFPGTIPLNAIGCNCTQGVVQGLYLGNPLVWQVPNDPAYVGIALSVQGWTIGGSQCLGFVDLSDTVDFTIR